MRTVCETRDDQKWTSGQLRVVTVWPSPSYLVHWLDETYVVTSPLRGTLMVVMG